MPDFFSFDVSRPNPNEKEKWKFHGNLTFHARFPVEDASSIWKVYIPLWKVYRPLANSGSQMEGGDLDYEHNGNWMEGEDSNH